MNMKNNTTKIILSAIVFLSATSFAGIAAAATPSLYVSPANLTKTVGNTFSASVVVNASGNKFCAVEGTLVFDNLSCQSITVASDSTPQSSPTCSNPYFLIGVPNCATSDKSLLIVSVRAGKTGTASIGLTGVDIMGEGVSVGSASASANYTINAVSKPTPISASVSTPTPNTVPVLISTSTSVSGTTTENKIEETSMPETVQTAASEEKKVVVVQPEEQQIGEEASFLASISSVVTFGTDNVLIGILTGLIIFVLVAYAIYAFIQRKRNKQS
jgi:hypothetical protein